MLFRLSATIAAMARVLGGLVVTFKKYHSRLFRADRLISRSAFHSGCWSEKNEWRGRVVFLLLLCGISPQVIYMYFCYKLMRLQVIEVPGIRLCWLWFMQMYKEYSADGSDGVCLLGWLKIHELYSNKITNIHSFDDVMQSLG